MFLPALRHKVVVITHDGVDRNLMRTCELVGAAGMTAEKAA